jgi:hypothetical protein
VPLPAARCSVPFLANAEAAISSTRKSRANDRKILNFALTLEFLEAEFYNEANRNNPFGPNEPLRVFARITGAHENAHVRTLRSVLGSAAVSKPKFSFGDTVTDPARFAATAQVLEDTGVAAYAGQGPNLLQRPLVKAALSIHSVEARHAAWIRFINSGGNGDPGKLPAPRSFDTASSERAILSAVGKTNFIDS